MGVTPAFFFPAVFGWWDARGGPPAGFVPFLFYIFCRRRQAVGGAWVLGWPVKKKKNNMWS
ncbi:hypothetical protein DCJ06_24915 [Salmonella enterica subsp. enterica serovar Kentucky]|nr:hypothetical protein [Salmonella enterica subsp. enterica serovar Kentucky]